MRSVQKWKKGIHNEDGSRTVSEGGTKGRTRNLGSNHLVMWPVKKGMVLMEVKTWCSADYRPLQVVFGARHLQLNSFCPSSKREKKHIYVEMH